MMDKRYKKMRDYRTYRDLHEAMDEFLLSHGFVFEDNNRYVADIRGITLTAFTQSWNNDIYISIKRKKDVVTDFFIYDLNDDEYLNRIIVDIKMGAYDD